MSNWQQNYPPQGGYAPQYGAYQPMPPNGPNPGYSQPYAAPSGPPQSYGNEKDPYAGGRFKPKKKINDIIFLILFVAQFLGFAAISGYVIREWVRVGGATGGVGGNTGGSATLNEHTVILLLMVTGAGLVLSTLYLILTRAFTSMIMHITLVLSIIMTIALCAYYWYTKYYSAAIIFTIAAVLAVLSYWGMRARIPFSSLMLQVVMDVAKHHKSVYVVAFTSLFVQAALGVWFTFTAVATYTRWSEGSAVCKADNSCSSGKVTGLIFFEVFSFIWTSQVVGNIALATLAGGPFGCWYYFGPREQGNMPNHPTLSAFVRASTLSLGSIAFGSLIVTILELIRLILRAVRDNAADNDNPIGAILACCAECIVGCIQSLVEYFNRYAYIRIALYGSSYITAAKETWHMITDRGIDALINDSLVGITIQWGSFVVGLLCSLFAYAYLRYTHPSYNNDGQYTVPVVLFAFVIGAQCLLTLGSALEAGVSTIFVGLGEDPQILAQRAPALWAKIVETYPHVTQAVHHV